MLLMIMMMVIGMIWGKAATSELAFLLPGIFINRRSTPSFIQAHREVHTIGK